MISDFTATRIDPSSRLSEYELIALPDEATGELVQDEINFLDTSYNLTCTMKEKPCIPMAIFHAREGMEATYVRWIQNICNLQVSFLGTFNNYSGFPPHTLYLRIQDPQPFLQLASRLKILDGFNQAKDCPPVQLAGRPHLAIAKGLSEQAYGDVIRDYARKTFHRIFKVEKLILVKKSWDGRSTEHICSFHLPSPTRN